MLCLLSIAPALSERGNRNKTAIRIFHVQSFFRNGKQRETRRSASASRAGEHHVDTQARPCRFSLRKDETVSTTVQPHTWPERAKFLPADSSRRSTFHCGSSESVEFAGRQSRSTSPRVDVFPLTERSAFFRSASPRRAIYLRTRRTCSKARHDRPGSGLKLPSLPMPRK